MKKSLFIFLYCGLCSLLYAQKNKVDSLATLLQSVRDTARVNMLNELSRILWYNDLNKANEYNTEALRLADSISFQKGLAEANRCRGVILSFEKDPAAMSYLEKALALFRKLNDKRGIAATLNNQSSRYVAEGNAAKALDAATEALNLFNELHDVEAIGAVTNKFGNIYELQSDFSAALSYYSKALVIRQQIGDIPGTSFSLVKVGEMYAMLNQYPQALDYFLQAYKLDQTHGRNQNLLHTATKIGDLYKKQGNYPEALKYYTESLKVEEDYEGKDKAVESFQRIGEIYLLQKKYDLALENFETALNNSKKINPPGSSTIFYSIAETYFEKKDYAKGLENATRSFNMARQEKKFALMKDAGSLLSQLYAATGDYPRAYQYRLESETAKDSVLNEDLNKRLASLQQSFEIKNRQTQIDLLNRDRQLKESELERQKQLRYVFIVGTLFFLCIAILLASNNRQKQKANTNLKKQKQQIENTLTELRNTQAQLLQKEKMASLGELTAGIAHEIQNPLNFVNNFSEITNELLTDMQAEIEKGNMDEVRSIANEVIETQEKINRHGKRADAIVKNMLQHSRSNRGEKELTDINALCDEYLRLAYHGMRANERKFNVNFVTDFDPSVPNINVTPQDIGRVLLNLINNAFYAMAEKLKRDGTVYEPTMVLKTKKIGNQIFITVKDSGSGIPPGILDKIFQPFFTTKPTGQGTGLGLSLSYDIVKAHGGEIKVKTNEGEGTEFTIQLNIA